MPWLVPGDVASFGQIEPVEGNDALTDATAAAVAFVERVRSDLFDTGQETELTAADVPGDVLLGAAMLGARLYARRGTMLGVAGFSDYGGASPLLRQDPDIERLLRIGAHAPFGFGAPPAPGGAA